MYQSVPTLSLAAVTAPLTLGSLTKMVSSLPPPLSPSPSYLSPAPDSCSLLSPTAPQAVTDLTFVENIQRRTIVISWTPPSERNGSLSYNVSYTASQIPTYTASGLPPSRANTTSGTFVVVNASNSSHTLCNTLPFAQYIVSVFAFNRQLGQCASSPTEMTTNISAAIGELALGNLLVLGGAELCIPTGRVDSCVCKHQ